mmetsp:Transcript_106111/g.300029  ORF Transcript_106111/g.300029 Transcript_106111/m.300029 type:complete len:255 (-) Transcript_106111:225-989(-)
MAAEPRSCNVCGAPAAKLCSRCKCRHYCGPQCQRSDWRSHKQYCEPPQTVAARVKALERTWLNDGGDQDSWQLMLRASRDGNAEVDPEKLQDIMIEAVKAQCPPEIFDEDEVGYSLDMVKQLGVLPSLPLVDDCFVMSFSTFGHMEQDTGELLYCTACFSNRTEQMRATSTTSGVPTVADCQSVLFAAMIKPIAHTGDPMRPTHVLIAHRWGEQAYESLRLFLTQHDIGIELESEEEAKHSATMNDADPMGFNV